MKPELKQNCLGEQHMSFLFNMMEKKNEVDMMVF